MKNLSSLVKSIRDIMRNDPGINGDAQRMEQIIWILFLKVYSIREENWEFDEDDYTSLIPEECQWSNWAVDNGTGKALTGDELLDFVNNILFKKLKDIPVTRETPVRKAIVQTMFAEANQYMRMVFC